MKIHTLYKDKSMVIRRGKKGTSEIKVSAIGKSNFQIEVGDFKLQVVTTAVNGIPQTVIDLI